jgi:hypothetical protein
MRETFVTLVLHESSNCPAYSNVATSTNSYHDVFLSLLDAITKAVAFEPDETFLAEIEASCVTKIFF